MSDDNLPNEQPFSISCRYCDAGCGLTVDEAIAECWMEIEFFPDGIAENFLGVCPNCLREMLKEADERRDASQDQSAIADTDTRDISMAKKSEATRPVHEVRLGKIKAAIWANTTENGIRHNVTIARLYKDGDDWKDSTSFGREDLPLVAKVADMAHTWVYENGSQGSGSES